MNTAAMLAAANVRPTPHEPGDQACEVFTETATRPTPSGVIYVTAWCSCGRELATTQTSIL